MVGAVPDCDVAVIGGGILGLATAALLSELKGYRVCVFRLGNSNRPRADTLRNQGGSSRALFTSGRLLGMVAIGQRPGSRLEMRTNAGVLG